MSTFIQLAQRLSTECGVSTTPPSTVIGATGEWSRLTKWVAQAWVDIQEHHPDWSWMLKRSSFDTTPLQGTYTPLQAGISDLADWRQNSFRAYLTSAGVGTEITIPFTAYERFYNDYLLGARKLVFSRPVEYTVGPGKSLLLGLAPDNIYTVGFEYFKAPVELVADADVPDMPSRFHMLIVYKAMMSYGAFEAANEVYQRGEKEYRSMMNKLELDQTMDFTRAGSLI